MRKDEFQPDVLSEIARLRAAIDREAKSAERMLNDHPSASEPDYPRWGGEEHRELNRQVSALYERVARASSRGEDRLLLRAELATLLSFAKTLRTDAEAWRLGLAAGIREFEREEAAERAERQRLADERAALVRRRDTLRSQIDQTAERMAEHSGGECRRTLPVFRLDGDLSVCSVSVQSLRGGFRHDKRWLVTLNASADKVVVKRS